MAIPTIQDLRSGDTTPSGPSYPPKYLIADTYLGLFRAGVIPAGPMPDPDGAHRAAADLLRAFGVTPAVST